MKLSIYRLKADEHKTTYDSKYSPGEVYPRKQHVTCKNIWITSANRRNITKNPSDDDIAGVKKNRVAG